MWLQYDFGDGPVIEGVKVVLFCAWLAWSRFRVVIPLGDRTLPSVIAALDTTFRTIGGVPTYVLTDNEKTVTDYHLCGIAVRNESAVAVSRYYGVSIVTCVPYDPESKGWATDCTSYLDVWEDVVSMRFGHRRRWCRTHPAARRRAA
jgi:transposase